MIMQKPNLTTSVSAMKKNEKKMNMQHNLLSMFCTLKGSFSGKFSVVPPERQSGWRSVECCSQLLHSPRLESCHAVTQSGMPPAQCVFVF